MGLAITSARASALLAAGTENNPILAWDNLAARATAITSNVGVQADGALANAAQPSTYDAWRPVPSASPWTAQFTLQMPGTEAPNLFGLIGHNLKAIGATGATFFTSPTGSTWTSIATLAVADMGGVADACYFVEGTARAWLRVTLEGLPANAQPEVAGIFVGSVVTIPERLYQGFAPILTPTEVELQANVTDGGQYIGAAVVKRGSRLQVPLAEVPATFFRGAGWQAFQRAWNDGQPSLFAWRPSKYAADLHYMWRDGAAIRPENSGPGSRMGAALEARVYEG